jgi:hypothetical protein
MRMMITIYNNENDDNNNYNENDDDNFTLLEIRLIFLTSLNYI